MRKSGWAVAATLGSLALLLAGCGGSSSSGGSTNPAAGGRPTSDLGMSLGDTVLIVQQSNLGWVLALANGDVVYTYANDKKGGQPSCSSSCSAVWSGVTGVPMTNSGETLPGQLGTVTLSSGAKQATYDGLPLYYLKSEKPLATTGNGMDGLWHVIKLSGNDISNG